MIFCIDIGNTNIKYTTIHHIPVYIRHVKIKLKRVIKTLRPSEKKAITLKTNIFVL